MAIALTGTGGFFTRLGALYLLTNSVNRQRGNDSLHIKTISGSGATITVTAVEEHGYSVGDTVKITGSNIAGYNATFTVAGITSSTVFTISNAATGTNTSTRVRCVRTAGGPVLPVAPQVDNIQDQYEAAAQAIIDNLYAYKSSFQTTGSSFLAQIATIAKNTIIQMAVDDAFISPATLSNAVTTLISQMTTSVDTVQKPTVSVAVTSGGSNNGDAITLASVLGPDGKQMDYVFDETITATVTSDSQGSATLGSEGITAVGEAAQADQTMWDWPAGSGTNLQYTAISATIDAGTNILTKSSFDSYTGGLPDKWVVTSAASLVSAGGSAQAYDGVNALLFTSNGSELTIVRQTFNDATNGTAGTLAPSTVYAFNIWIKVDVQPAAGAVRFALVDGNGTVVNDAAGTANSVTQSLTTLVSNTYTRVNGFFRTPKVMPSAIKFEIKETTAATNGTKIYFDYLAMGLATQLYSGGVFVATFSGNTKSIKNDTFSIVVHNNYDSIPQRALESLLGMRALGLQVPSAASPTISDSLFQQ